MEKFCDLIAPLGLVLSVIILPHLVIAQTITTPIAQGCLGMREDQLLRDEMKTLRKEFAGLRVRIIQLV
ncbi:MAG: hypothetical protein IPI00_18110 [Flavobacteriales bacterium]|nr:hypothetical protein [Flavobacteriales bacterium]HQX31015.1 hypothetical protein [Flavobacteriales bacterium]